MIQRISCKVCPFERSIDEVDLRFTLTTAGFSQQQTEQAAAALAAIAAENMRNGQLLIRQSSRPVGAVCQPDDGRQPAIAAGWHIRLRGSLAIAMDFSGKAQPTPGKAAVPVEWPEPKHDACEQVLLAFVLPFLDFWTTHFSGIDLADLATLLRHGSRGRMVATTLPPSTSTEQMAQAHQHAIRQAGIARATAAYSAFITSDRSLRERHRIVRVVHDEMHAEALHMYAHVPVRREDPVRFVTLLMFAEEPLAGTPGSVATAWEDS